MEIKKVIVLLNHQGMDRLTLETDLPSIMDGYSSLDVRCEAPSGRGLEYAFRHFPNSLVEVIDVKTGKVELHNPKTPEEQAKNEWNSFWLREH